MSRLFSLENKAARRFWLVAFFAFFFGELWMVTWAQHNKVRHVLNPVIWLIGGIGSALIGGWLSARFPSIFQSKIEERHDLRKKLVWFAYLLGAFAATFFLKKVYTEIPEFTDLTDILPGKREYIRRFLAGEIVYRPIPFPGYELAATYLPTRWLPFLAAHFLGIDYRWISFAGLLVGLASWANWLGKRSGQPGAEVFLKMTVPFALVAVIAVNDPASLGLAVELLMVGYYLVLAKNLVPREPWMLGFCLVLCLLSRYSLVVWCPVLAFVLFFEKGWKYVAAVAFWVVLGIFCLYLLPFCRHDMGRNFVEAYDYYIWGCFETWKPAPWQTLGDIPFNHARGIGFSFLFYKWAPGDLRERYDLMLRAGTWLGVAVSAASILFYWKKIRGRDGRLVEPFLLASLKVFMVVFTGFIVLPFPYLFSIPLFLTVPLLFRLPVRQIWSS